MNSAKLILDKGNGQAVQAFNAALLELWDDGTYDDLFRSYYGRSPERFSDCVESPLALFYPEEHELINNGLLDFMLEEQTVKMCYSDFVATFPSFDIQNGEVVGGFYPDLAVLILDRISRHYNIDTIVIEWVVNSVPAEFYPDHYEGRYDIIFMNLFKNAMFSLPLAPRPELWDFSCGLVTAQPLRYYVCQSAIDKGIDLTSARTINGPNTIVKTLPAGAQAARAEATFPDSQVSSVPDLTTLRIECENGSLDVFVELPDRITDTFDDLIFDDRAIGTYINTGAAFRKDKKDC